MLHVQCGSTDLLENGNGEGGGLASTRLGLRNDVVSFHNGDNSTLLDGGGAFETRSIFQSDSWPYYVPDFLTHP